MADFPGSNNGETINGSDLNDRIWGFGGSDVLNGGDGADTIWGGTGNDLVTGGGGADIMHGGNGNDTLSYANSVFSVIIYLASNSAFNGDAGGDVFDGFENLIGSRGHDNLYGDANANILTGGEGDDYLSGGDGNDQHFGQQHDDYMLGSLGADHYDGGTGNDVVSYHQSNAAVHVDLALFTASGGYAEGDTLQQVERLQGSDQGDTLNGDALENTMYGGGGNGNDNLAGRGGDDGLFGINGNDTLEGGLDSDYLDGGEGADTASYRNATEGVSIALTGAFIAEGEAVGDILISIERLLGSDFDDELRGDGAANTLTGVDGDDLLNGRGGNDVLYGGEGGDTLIGGGGNDFFDYKALNQGGDQISDFSPAAVGNNDTLRFAGNVFGGLSSGALDATRFVSNATGLAETAAQRFIYETDTGILRYDSNGTLAGGITIIATLSGAPVITLADFEIL